MEKIIDIFIPVYKPDERLKVLIARLMQQTLKPRYIYLLHTLEEEVQPLDMFYEKEWKEIIREIPIEKKDFDHGGTRAYGASLSDAEFLLFMTQDAVPANQILLENLMIPFADEKIAACYARQLPRKEAKTVERLIRQYNYPDTDRIQSAEDIDTLGIKAYFCSDVCAVYKRSVYEEMGGFVKKTIFNEDMIMAADMITSGYRVAYASSAKVLHSHSYTLRQQFSRNFDLAVSQVQYRRVFEGISSESEGLSMVKAVCIYLIKHGQAFKIPYFILDCAAKFAGYRLGKQYHHLPKKVVRACSMNKGYWQT